MADKKLRSKFLEDKQIKYSIVLSMKELTSASEVIGQGVVFVLFVGCGVIELFLIFVSTFRERKY